MSHPVDSSRELHFCSDFPHLVKCIRNTFVSTGFTTPDGRACIEDIEVAWAKDNSSLTLKAMPHVTKAHIRPNSFEKMKVNLAFTLFSEEVLKGMFLYRSDVPEFSSSVSATEQLVRRLSRLISIMTSRCPKRGLRPSSQDVAELEAFLVFLDAWEEASKKCGGGFMSKGTAEGMRVTIRSTLSLLQYLTSSVAFKYLLTSRLSQDKLENLFGIIRQYSGTNDHPSPGQFLITVNCLSFYNLARPPKSGNSPAQVVNALLDTTSSAGASNSAVFGLREIIEDMLEAGDIDGAGDAIQSAFRSDHSSYVVEKSDSRLVYYLSGYVARKFRTKNSCGTCASKLAMKKQDVAESADNEFTKHFDRGGLLYPGDDLAILVATLEEAFTFFFSTEKLQAFSIHDFMSFLSTIKLHQVGCANHGKELTAKIVQFFVLTRLHFYTKSLNKDRSVQRQKQKHLKLRRCQ